ncbi:MAG: hypothetical protein WBF47_18140 [Xanthobacteraceae bacterium]|jgi:hypothetical protein
MFAAPRSIAHDFQSEVVQRRARDFDGEPLAAELREPGNRFV